MSLADERDGEAYSPRLKIENLPRIPFSSPTREDFLFPHSPSLSCDTNWKRRKNFRDAKGSDQLRSGRILSPKAPNHRLPRRQEKDHKKTRWPGLNIVTSFSKAPVVNSSSISLNHKGSRKTPPQTLNGQLGSVTSSDCKAPTHSEGDRSLIALVRNESSLGTTRSDPRLRNNTAAEEKGGNSPIRGTEGLGLQPLKDPSACEAGVLKTCQSQENNLKPSPTKLTELSPSDGPIVIGISVPSAKIAEHAISPDAEPMPISAATHAVNQSLPETPTIVVTPVKYHGSWYFPDPTLKSRGRRRAPSSIYSQVIQQGGYIKKDHGTSPLPAPSDRSMGLRHDASESVENIYTTISHERPESTCTVFDEDDKPIDPADEERPGSSESRLRMLKRLSLDTIATKHRSQGWWNYIVSPFLPRSNATSFAGWVPRPTSSVPALPSPSLGALNHHALQVSNPNLTGPLSIPDSATVVEEHKIIWADLRQLEAERLQTDSSFDQTSQNSSPSDPVQSRKAPHDLNALELFEGFGAAAEYYNACWHDQNSPNPYFECQNHFCVLKADVNPVSVEESGKHVDINGSPNDGKGTDTHTAICGFQQEPANRFSAAFCEANPSKRRALSEATEFEDGDATPEVYEARVAPVLRAGPPIAAVPVAVPIAGPVVAVDVQRPDPKNPLPAAATSLPAKSLIALPTYTEASFGQAPVAASTNTSIASHAFLPERKPFSSPETTRNVPQQLPALKSSMSDKLPDQPLVRNPSDRFFPIREGSTLSETEPLYSETKRSSQQVAMKKEIPSENVDGLAHNTYIVNHYYNQVGRSKRDKVTSDDQRLSVDFDLNNTKKWERHEKVDYQSRGSKFRGLGKARFCFKQKQRPMAKKKKRLLWGVAASMMLIIVLILVLVMSLHRKGDGLKVQSQWLNVTGFPPVPTGISTIVQPDIVREDSGCIQPATVWSCALPKEEQESIAPNNANQPNFRVEIRFRNATSTNSTAASGGDRERRWLGPGSNPVSGGSSVRGRYLQIRDSFTDSLFSPTPVPPTQEDQAFLGKTTDNNSAPFDGEITPFFMSFVPASKLPVQRLVKRQEKESKNDTTDGFPDITKTVPPPDTNADGTAAAANLLPFPIAQPLRLYNRGLTTEHYGFYTYFDRSIFLKSTSLLNDAGPVVGDVPTDRNGGADQSAATVRCTWRQTRFLVQIWTNSGAAAPLLGSSNATSTKAEAKDDQKNLTSSSANDFLRPGSFPYPVSITLDRHGGALDEKFIFCFGLDKRGHVILEKKKIQLEDRSFGGVLVNPALGPFRSTKVAKKEGGPGGIDGGSGGCGCQWRNWEGSF